MFPELATTFVNRPYVFLFLLGYLFFSIRSWGVRRSLVWLVVCYIVAFASEASSIRTGFPYGYYRYLYENLNGELIIFGVPFFDSLSYCFLIYAGYGLAQRITNSRLKLILLGALFTMMLDMIVDPLATIGERWFLGQIHEYKYSGYFFGVPLTNFLGWYVTSAFAIAANILINKGPLPKSGNGPLILYSGVALFDFAIAYWLGEIELAFAQAAILFLAIKIADLPSVKSLFYPLSTD